MEKTSISNRSTKFFTLNGISEATKYLLKLKTKIVTPNSQNIAAEFWNCVSKNIPEWNLLMEKKVSASDLRVNYVHSHTNMLNALGIMGHVLISQYPDSWKSKLKGLQKMDWARDGPIWEGKVVIDGRMMKQKAGIKKAADVLLKGCGATMTLDDFENNERKS
jgi:DNA sulfur modification protein DndB